MNEERRTKQVNVKLTPSEYRELKKLQKLLRRSMSDSARIAILDKIAALQGVDVEARQ